MKYFLNLLIITIFFSCNTYQSQETNTQDSTSHQDSISPDTKPNITFGYDVDFLKKYDSSTIILANGDAQIIVSPKFQGRVMTATTEGLRGISFGWLNYDLIQSGQFVPQINAFGGADRFWLGPEGGQYAIFFKKGDTFDIEHWQTPAPIDTETFELVSQDSSSVKMQKVMRLINYSGTVFDLKVDRTIRLLDRMTIENLVGKDTINQVQCVAYQSDNRVTNIGKNAWTKDKGLLSIWILGMYNASPQNTVVIPIISGNNSQLGVKVNDDYFGKIPLDRLMVSNNIVFFKADAKLRSKIGISPQRSKDVIGSYDAEKQTLTIVKFTFNPTNTDYVNSQWKIQENPYAGDVSNSYNDSNDLGNFYELETSSPALALKPNESKPHIHTTLHFTGDKKTLDKIARKFLEVGIEEINTIFGK
jgi:hypothetical protein